MKPARKSGNRLWLVVGLMWILVIVGGMRVLLRYETVSGSAGDPPGVWPVTSRIQRIPGLPTIVVMGHPRCPCTRATIGELALIMTRLNNKVHGVVVFVRPQGTPDGWDDTDVRRSAAAIPSVTVMTDLDETEADLFNAQVSGQTMLYDTTGKLLFRGGITAARGHSGDNAGRSTIISFVTDGAAQPNRTPVYGCALRTPKSSSGERL
jgi:hypothetical protein